MKVSKKRLALLTACVITAVSNCAFAEESELETYDAAEYVVTATKTPLEKKDVPMAVEVIGEEEIKAAGAYSVQDALRFSTNIDVSDNGMTGNQVQVRGMDSNKVLVLIDGRRIASENTSSTTNVYELNRINMAEVERIEVIRGNGSALYGSDAMAGVINIITKKATQPSFNIDMHTGSKESGYNFSYASGREGKLSFKASGGVNKIRERFIDPYESDDNGINAGNNMHGMRRFLNLGFDYALTEDTGLKFDMNFMRESLTQTSTATGSSSAAKYSYLATMFTQGASSADMANKLNDSLGYNYTQEEYAEAATNMSGLADYYGASTSYARYDNNRSDYVLTYYGKDDKNDWNVRAYYNILKKDEYTYGTSYYSGASVGFDTLEYENFVIDGKNSQKIDDHHTLTYGAEWMTNTYSGTRMGANGDKVKSVTKYGVTKDSSEKKTDTYAAYIQDEIKLGKKLLVIPAVRFDHHEDFGSEASPKIGVTYKLSDSSRFKVNYGKSYRAPTPYELYAGMVRSPMSFITVNIYGNADLEPEEAKNFDISFEAEKGKGSMSVGYFHNDITDMIDTKDIGSSGSTYYYTYTNIAKAVIQGFESEFSYRFDDNWKVRATYNYIDAVGNSVDDDGSLTGMERLNRPRHNGIVQLSYTDAAEMPWNVNLWWQWYADYKYSSHKDANGNTVPNIYSYGTLNLVTDKQISKNLRVYAGVDNIFDKTYAYNSDYSYYINGRMWRIGAQMTF